MLPKEKRIPRELFDAVFRSGVRTAGHFCTIIKTPSSGTPTVSGARYAVVVSKKIEPTAVGRNLLRRRIYELLGMIDTEEKPQGAFIVLVKKEGKDVVVSEWMKELTKLIQK